MLFIEAGFHTLEFAFLLQLLQFPFQLLDPFGCGFLLAFKIGALGEIEPGQQFDDLLVAQPFVYFVKVAEIFFQAAGKFRQARAFELSRAFAVTDDQVVRRTLQDDFVERVVVLDVLQGLSLLDRIERRLGDENVAARDQLLHVTEEEGEQQGADVASVHVRVGHQDDLAVA